MNRNPKSPNKEYLTIYQIGHSESIRIYESKPDSDIWKAFNGGDELAFNYIYRIYVTVLFKYGCQLCKDQSHNPSESQTKTYSFTLNRAFGVINNSLDKLIISSPLSNAEEMEGKTISNDEKIEITLEPGEVKVLEFTN